MLYGVVTLEYWPTDVGSMGDDISVARSTLNEGRQDG